MKNRKGVSTKERLRRALQSGQRHFVDDDGNANVFVQTKMNGVNGFKIVKLPIKRGK